MKVRHVTSLKLVLDEPALGIKVKAADSSDLEIWRFDTGPPGVWANLKQFRERPTLAHANESGLVDHLTRLLLQPDVPGLSVIQFACCCGQCATREHKALWAECDAAGVWITHGYWPECMQRTLAEQIAVMDQMSWINNQSTPRPRRAG